jgi:hypothetical protein
MKFTMSAGEVFLGCCVAVTVGPRNGMGGLQATRERASRPRVRTLEATVPPH